MHHKVHSTRIIEPFGAIRKFLHLFPLFCVLYAINMASIKRIVDFSIQFRLIVKMC